MNLKVYCNQCGREMTCVGVEQVDEGFVDVAYYCEKCHSSVSLRFESLK